jgi:hypothetical protein
MIYKNVKTVYVAEDPFKIPGSDLTIYTIKLEIDGVRDLYKTMSEKIAVEDWEGDVEVYTNKNGKEYVRQAPKEEGNFTPKAGKSSWTAKDEKSITLGLVFKTFCSVEGMLPQSTQHWGYIEAAARKLIQIGAKLNQVENPPTTEGREKFEEIGQQLKAKVEAKKEATKRPPVDEYGNTDEYVNDIDLSEIPF